MNIYHEIKALNFEGETEVLYGSFVRSDCKYELDTEKETWLDEGYTQIIIIGRTTDEQPDLEVYADNIDELIEDDNIDFEKMVKEPENFTTNLNELYLSYFNDFISVSAYAEYYGMSETTAHQIINLGRAVNWDTNQRGRVAQ